MIGNIGIEVDTEYLHMRCRTSIFHLKQKIRDRGDVYRPTNDSVES